MNRRMILAAAASLSLLSTGCGGTVGAGDGLAQSALGVHGLLRDRMGLALGVTGGAAALENYHVTTNADSGPGSLRDALTGEEPRWIVFDDDLHIELKTTVVVGSNKTVDGRGHKVRIGSSGGRGTKTRTTGFELSHVSNIIFENLTLSGFGDQDQTKSNNPADGVALDTAEGVWIDHCDLSGAADKAISVASGSTNVTISHNHFHDQLQNIQIGSQSTAGTGDPEQTVLVYANYFDAKNSLPTKSSDDTYQNSGYRHPVIAHGRVHVLNNVNEGWIAYATRSERGGRMFLEGNVFIAAEGGNTAADKTRPQGVPEGGPPPGMDCSPNKLQCVAPYKNVCGCNDNCKNCDPSPGFIMAKGNMVLNGAEVVENDPQKVQQELVQSPEFNYDLPGMAASAAMRQQIISEVGPQ